MLASSVTTFIIALYSFSKKKDLSFSFAMSCIFCTIYSFGYAFEIYSIKLSDMIFWNQIEYLGIPFIPAFWVLMAMLFNNRISKNKFTVVAIFIIPVITFFARLTNSMHHVYYTDMILDKTSPIAVMKLIRGPWYYVAAAYSILIICYTIVCIAKQLQKSTGLIKKQCYIMLTGTAIPLLAIVLDTLNLVPWGLDLGPFSTSITCMLFLVAIFRFRFLNLKPLAREIVFEYTNDGIIVLDMDNVIIDCNPSAKRIIPLLNSDCINRNISTVINISKEVIYSIENFSDTRFDISNENGKANYHIKTTEIFSKKHQIIGRIVTITEITKYVDIMDKYSQLATRDELTGAFSRRYFAELAETEFRNAHDKRSPFSVCMLDIDYFKNVNDRLGHQAGDLLLKEVTRIILSSIRTDDIIGRMGGDEFLIAFPDSDIKDAVRAAERIRKNIEHLNVFYDNNNIKITVSLGLCSVTDIKDYHLDDLIKNSDIALYKAKGAGRNCVRYEVLD